MDKVMGFYISPYLMLSIMFFSVMHFHDHLCISISPKNNQKMFAKMHCGSVMSIIRI